MSTPAVRRSPRTAATSASVSPRPTMRPLLMDCAGIRRLRPRRGHGAVAAPPRAAVAEEHERGRPAGEAFAQVGATRLLAHGVELLVAQEHAQSARPGRERAALSSPLGKALTRDRRNGHEATSCASGGIHFRRERGVQGGAPLAPPCSSMPRAGGLGGAPPAPPAQFLTIKGLNFSSSRRRPWTCSASTRLATEPTRTLKNPSAAPAFTTYAANPLPLRCDTTESALALSLKAPTWIVNVPAVGATALGTGRALVDEAA